MNKTYLNSRTVVILAFVLSFLLPQSHPAAYAQRIQPYSYQFYQKLNRVQYSWDTRQHTAVKPMILDSLTNSVHDSLMQIGYRERSTWAGRKIWNEHLLEVEEDDFYFYADFLPDFQIGRDFASGGKTTWLNSRGFQAGGSVMNRFFFYTSGYENQGVFPEYVDEFINTNRVVPGQMYGKIGKETQDWTYVSAILAYKPSEALTFSLAYDKNFIGDGYRSMLLSDISSNSTSFKFNGTFSDINVTSIWSYMLDPREARNEDFRRSRSQRKYGAFQYVDWNVSNRFSLGIFHSLIWANRLADRTLVNADEEPIGDVATGDGASSTMQVGLNSKFKALPNATVYGQILLNREMAAQLGIRGFDALGIKNLNFLAEFNYAQPYAYTSDDPLSNYSNYGQPLAHPFGANFNELVGILNYSYQKFDFSLQGNYGHYGSRGKNIFIAAGSTMDQAVPELTSNLLFADARVAYLINPKYNLRLEAGTSLRRETNDVQTRSSGMITLGLRASFRNLYYDF